jgi:RNA polymerase sigma-70 factor, ECF subfamily
MRPFGETAVSLYEETAKRRERMLCMSALTTERVWEEFHAPLQQFIRRRISDEETAEDVLQDVFLRIHQHMDALKDVRKLESWIYQITRNAIIDAHRSRRQEATLEAAEVLDLPEELPDDDIVSELLPSVRAMVRNLPELDRQALVLTEYQGRTQKELAERLGLSLSGAKSRVQRAREKLKQQLLECCHFELDRRRHIIDYQPRCQCCVTAGCCADEPRVLPMPTRSRRDASFLGLPRL